MEEWLELLEKISICFVVWWDHKCSSILCHKLIPQRRGWKIKTLDRFGGTEDKDLSLISVRRLWICWVLRRIFHVNIAQKQWQRESNQEFWVYLLSKPLLLMLCVSPTPRWSIWISHSTSQFRVTGCVRKSSENIKRT